MRRGEPHGSAHGGGDDRIGYFGPLSACSTGSEGGTLLATDVEGSGV